MKIEKSVQQQLIKNALLSLLIYALPVLLLFLTYYIKGEKPWLKSYKTVNTINTSK